MLYIKLGVPQQWYSKLTLLCIQTAQSFESYWMFSVINKHGLPFSTLDISTNSSEHLQRWQQHLRVNLIWIKLFICRWDIQHHTIEVCSDVVPRRCKVMVLLMIITSCFIVHTCVLIIIGQQVYLCICTVSGHLVSLLSLSHFWCWFRFWLVDSIAH